MSLRKSAYVSVLWTSLQQFANQGVNFVVGVVLARILSPSEFGLLAMIYIFIGISNVLINSGLSSSLIRTKDADDEDFSTVFFFNLAMSIFFYVLIFLVAPLIADFYSQPALVHIIRLYCLTFIIGAITTVQAVQLQKQLNFKIETIASISSNVVAGITGITLAYQHFGVMTLVWMALISGFTKSFIFWWKSDWRPSFVFSKKKFKFHFRFGVNLTFTSILDVIFENIYNIYIGKFYSPLQLGLYNRADSLKQLPVSNVLGVLGKITYPLFSQFSDDNEKLKIAYKEVMITICFFITPVLIISGVLGKPLIVSLFSEKWIDSVPYFQILCIVGVFYPLRVYNTNIFLVKGRSDLFFKLEIVKKVIFILIFIVSFKFGIYGLLWGQVFYNVISYVIESVFAGKFINYTFFEQFKAILPVFLIGISSGLVTLLFINVLSFNGNILNLILGGLVGCCSFLVFVKILKIQIPRVLVDLLKFKNNE